MADWELSDEERAQRLAEDAIDRKLLAYLDPTEQQSLTDAADEDPHVAATRIARDAAQAEVERAEAALNAAYDAHTQAIHTYISAHHAVHRDLLRKTRGAHLV